MAPWKPALFSLLIVFLFLTAITGCSGDDDDDDNDSGQNPDDDDSDDDDAASDDDDAASGRIPTTLDMNFLPQKQDDTWVMVIGPGDRRIVRNDLGVALPNENQTGRDRLSLAYFFTGTDLHVADEESPTRLDFFESKNIFLGAFDSAGKPQYDLSPHTINSLARTAKQIQTDYKRDFDFALFLGDNSDNSQVNELSMLIDVLDGGGLLTDQGWCRVDSGDLNLDGNGRDLGERNFDFQQTNGDGEIINPYYRPDAPDSNADFQCTGLRRSSGGRLPWFTAIGNHDVINMGTFDPMTSLTFYQPEEYVGDKSPYGFLSGLGTTIEYWKEHPHQKLKIANGILGLNLNWGLVFSIIEKIGILGDYLADIVDDFVLMDLLHDTPANPADDGVPITADADREYMDVAGAMDLLYQTGHALFEDRNGDNQVTEADGGYYTFDAVNAEGKTMPLRFVVLNTAEKLLFPQGGVTEPQLAWLESVLTKAEEDRVLVVIGSHHQESDTIAGGKELEATLSRHPNVIAHLVGHGHDNMIEAHTGPGGDPYRGYWEIETPSSIDFPQQWRIIEIVDNRDGSGSIFLTNFDHFSLEDDDPDVLSDLSRQLAFADVLADGYQGSGVFGHRGVYKDRNVELLFAIPTEVLMKLAEIEATQPVTSAETLGRGADIPESAMAKSGLVEDESAFEPKKKPMNMTGVWMRLVEWSAENDPDGLGRKLDELRPLSADEQNRLRELGYLR